VLAIRPESVIEWLVTAVASSIPGATDVSGALVSNHTSLSALSSVFHVRVAPVEEVDATVTLLKTGSDVVDATVTVVVEVSERPAAFVTVKVIGYVPGSAYVCVKVAVCVKIG
jgi:hypothetical protein